MTSLVGQRNAPISQQSSPMPGAGTDRGSELGDNSRAVDEGVQETDTRRAPRARFDVRFWPLKAA